MKRIVVDARFYFASGIGTYLQNLLPALVQQRSDLEFRLVVRPDDAAAIAAAMGRARLILCPLTPFSADEQFSFQRYLPAQYDLLWIPHFNFPVLSRGPHLLTLHDLSLRSPQYQASIAQRLYAWLIFPIMARRARMIITDSNATRRDFISFFGVRDQLYRIYPGLATERFQRKRPGGTPRKRPYILCIGNIKPHKNLGAVLKAYQLLAESARTDLVIVGRMDGLRSIDRKLIDEAALQKGVILAGRVPDDELVRLLQHATLFVFPSRFEGFGYPPLEALAAGTPVAVSNLPVVREVCGAAAQYFDPDSPEDIARVMRDALNKRRRQAHEAAGGRTQVQFFHSRYAVAETSALIDAAVDPQVRLKGPPLAYYRALTGRYSFRWPVRRGDRNRPLVSIITITLNSAATIGQTIQSVWNQSYRNIEYIVLDGGSTDGTWSLLQKHRHRFALLAQIRDQGISDALNQAIALARGQIIGIIHSDDWYETNAAELAVDALKRNPEAGFVCAAQQYWRNDRRDAVFPSMPDRLGLDMTINHPTCFVRRSVYQQVGLFKLHYRAAMDYEFFLRLKRYSVKGVALPRVTANMRFGGASDQRWILGLREIRLAQKELYSANPRYFFLFVAKAAKSIVGRALASLGLNGVLKVYRRRISGFSRRYEVGDSGSPNKPEI